MDDAAPEEEEDWEDIYDDCEVEGNCEDMGGDDDDCYVDDTCGDDDGSTDDEVCYDDDGNEAECPEGDVSPEEECYDEDGEVMDCTDDGDAAEEPGPDCMECCLEINEHEEYNAYHLLEDCPGEASEA